MCGLLTMNIINTHLTTVGVDIQPCASNSILKKINNKIICLTVYLLYFALFSCRE